MTLATLRSIYAVFCDRRQISANYFLLGRTLFFVLATESDVRRAFNKTSGKDNFSAFLRQMSDRMREVYLQDHSGQEQQ